MASVLFRGATSISGNNSTQPLTMPTVLPGDLIVLGCAFVQTGAITLAISGAGTWNHQGADSVIAGQIQMACYTAISTDGSESGAVVNAGLGSVLKLALFAASYSGVALGGPLGLSTPTYAQNTTSNTTSATTPSVSPVPSSMVLSAFASKSSTNASYTTPAGLSSRTSAFGSGGGALDIVLFDTNGIVSSGGGQTSTLGTATANKIAMTLVLNTDLTAGLTARQAVNRAANF